jgi:NAD(P)H-flavin reductase
VLVKAETSSLAGLAAGDAVAISAPLGKGFPVDVHAGRDVILCAAGTGIAPLRGVIRHILPRRDQFGRITLYYGQRSPAEFAYAREQDEWRSGGVHVVTVVSDPDVVGWPGARGWIQDAVRATEIVPDNTVAFLAGMSVMVKAVTDVLLERGVPRERILLNF